MCNIGKVPNPSIDSSTLSPPTMTQLVGETVHSRRVRCIDEGCNWVLGFVGVALMAFSVAMIIITSQAHGFSLNVTPVYAVLGVVGLAGTALSILSIKRMITSCQKREQFREDVREVTS